MDMESDWRFAGSILTWRPCIFCQFPMADLSQPCIAEGSFSWQLHAMRANSGQWDCGHSGLAGLRGLSEQKNSLATASGQPRVALLYIALPLLVALCWVCDPPEESKSHIRLIILIQRCRFTFQ